MNKRKKIAYVVSSPMTAQSFLLGYFEKLAVTHDVYLIANFSGEKPTSYSFDGIVLIDISIQRKISLFKDFTGLCKLYSTFREFRFDIVHSVTPKAGLLAMLASMIAGNKNRFHTFTGQVWVNYSGFKRYCFKALDRLTSYCSTNILVDSPSQRHFLINENIVSERKSKVLANGSISGVDCQKFSPSENYRKELREQLGLSDAHFVFLFLGRVNRDKGIVELLDAFERLSKDRKREMARLLIIGPDEDDILQNIVNPNIVIRGFTTAPQKFMACADIFCLPSHREGFGSVVIEAAATGLPAIGSNIYGISDAIEDGVTGLLHKVKDPVEIVDCMRLVMDNSQMTKSLSFAARKRALSEFSPEHITDALVEFYSNEYSKN